MNMMNGPSPGPVGAITGGAWSWIKRGGWNLWGKFGTGLGCERMWTWIQGQNANCGVTDYTT